MQSQMRTRKHEDRKFCSQHILLTMSPKKRNVKTNHGPVSYCMLAHVLHAYSGALAREKCAHRSTMGKKICISSKKKKS